MKRNEAEQEPSRQSLHQASQYARSLIEASLDPLVTISAEGKITDVNEAAIRATGLARQELVGADFATCFTEPEKARDGYRKVFDQGYVTDYPLTIRHKDGRLMEVLYNASVYQDGDGKVLGVFAAARDVTERNRTEKELKKHREHLEELVRERTAQFAKLTRLYAVLSQANEAIVRVHDAPALYSEVCRILAEKGGFPLVWIGETQQSQVVPVASWGSGTDYVQEIRVEVEGALGAGPTGTCIRENRTVVNDDFEINHATAPWRPSALKYGFRASAAFPLCRQGRPIGAMTLYACDPGTFDAEQVGLLESLTANLSYALDALDREQLRARAERELAEAHQRMKAILQAVPVGISFSNDPTCRSVSGNPAVLAQFEVCPEDNLSASAPSPSAPGRQVRFFKEGRPISDAELPLQRAVAENRPIPPIELEVELPSGRRWHAAASGAPVCDAQGNVIGGVAVTVDLTERKRAEQAVRESEERLQYALETSHTGAWDLDLVGHTAFRSLEHDRIFGYAELLPEWTYEMFLEHVLPEDREAVDANFRQAIAARSDWNFECRILRIDGQVRWIWGAGRHRLDASGDLQRMAGIVQDITERKEAEREIELLNQSLRLRIAELQAIFDTAPIGLAITEDAEAHHIHGNPANEQMLGVGMGGELSKRGPQAAGYRCLEEGRELAVAELPMQRAARGEAVSGQVLDIVRQDGKTVTLYSTAAPLRDENGKPRGAVGAFLDITSLKRAEERTQILSEVTAQLLASDRPQRIVEALCRRVMDHLGCHAFFNFLVDGEAGRLHLNACTGIPEETARRIEWLDFGTAVCGCVARDGCRIVAEHIQTTPDPRTDLIRSFGIQAYACHPLMNQSQVIGTLSFGSRSKPVFAADELELMKFVTDHVAIAMQRIRLLESLERHAQAAQAANEAKSQFLANMSHELRTPMNAILGMIDFAIPKADSPTVKDCLQTAKGSADLLLTLLNDLLDSAKIESGKLELEVVPFSLRRMLDQMTRALSMKANEKGLHFTCRISEETPDAVIGDRVRLQQVLLNLAGNAVKFTERGEVVVAVKDLGFRTSDLDARVETNPKTQDPRPKTCTLQFEVSDTGIGISDSDRERLFQPFAQSDASMARRFGGTGLGLAICKNLVELMGGRIWVESSLGRGSTFFFSVSLPLANELPADLEATVAVLPAAWRPLRVLLVEDNAANQKLAAYILKDRGHRVEIAGNGREAISLAEQNGYDAILMDVQMPGMNGLEAAAAIRNRENGNRRVPIIAMTAHAMKGDRERCLEAGMDGYLSKPIEGRELIALLESLVDMGDRGTSHIPPNTTEMDIMSEGSSHPSDSPPPPTAERLDAARSAPVFDAASAITRCYGKEELLAKIIQFYYDDVEKLLPQIRAALQRGDLTEVGRLGHRLKGTIVYLSAEPAKEAALQVERLGMPGGELLDAEEAVSLLEQECRTLSAALAAHQAATGSSLSC